MARTRPRHQPTDDTIQVRIARVLDSVDPHKQMETFLELCEAWKRQERPWIALDERLDNGPCSSDLLLTRIDDAIAAHMKAVIPAQAYDQMTRLRMLNKTRWQLRPSQVLRDLGQDALFIKRFLVSLRALGMEAGGEAGHATWEDTLAALNEAREKRLTGKTTVTKWQPKDVASARQALQERGLIAPLAADSTESSQAANTCRKRAAAEMSDDEGGGQKEDGRHGEGAGSPPLPSSMRDEGGASKTILDQHATQDILGKRLKFCPKPANNIDRDVAGAQSLTSPSDARAEELRRESQHGRHNSVILADEESAIIVDTYDDDSDVEGGYQADHDSPKISIDVDDPRGRAAHGSFSEQSPIHSSSVLDLVSGRRVVNDAIKPISNSQDREEEDNDEVEVTMVNTGSGMDHASRMRQQDNEQTPASHVVIDGKSELKGKSTAVHVVATEDRPTSMLRLPPSEVKPASSTATGQGTASDSLQGRDHVVADPMRQKMPVSPISCPSDSLHGDHRPKPVTYAPSSDSSSAIQARHLLISLRPTSCVTVDSLQPETPLRTDTIDILLRLLVAPSHHVVDSSQTQPFGSDDSRRPYGPLKHVDPEVLPPMVAPLLVDGNHFAIAYVHPTARRCIIMDPWRDQTYHKQSKTLAHQFVQRLPGPRDNWTILHAADHPLQSDVHSCGIRIVLDAMWRTSGMETQPQVSDCVARSLFTTGIINLFGLPARRTAPSLLPLPSIPQYNTLAPGTSLSKARHIQRGNEVLMSTYEQKLHACESELATQQSTFCRVELAIRRLLDGMPATQDLRTFHSAWSRYQASITGPSRNMLNGKSPALLDPELLESLQRANELYGSLSQHDRAIIRDAEGMGHGIDKLLDDQDARRRALSAMLVQTRNLSDEVQDAYAELLRRK